MRVASGKDRWAVILAGGDGTRLQSLTRMISGDDRPKQFCAFQGSTTLLDQTRKRIALSVPNKCTLTVVTQTHERFYKPLFQNRTKSQLLVQPINKGTAPAILLSALKIAQLSPNATVAFFPSDHHFTNESQFMTHVENAFSAAPSITETITLLGIKPDKPEISYGWIEPDGTQDRATSRFSRVKRFWEKPSYYNANDQLREVIEMIAAGDFSKGDRTLFRPLVESLLQRDEYQVFADYQSYVDRQEQVGQAFDDYEHWTKMSIINVARMGYFSSDRSIQEYSDRIWKVKPVKVEI